MSNPFTCLALSPAGKVPQYGRNPYHIWDGKPMPGVGWFCDESKVSVNTWDGGPEFAAHHWNRRYDKHGIDAPAGWRWGELEADRVYMGGSERIVRKCFIGFYTTHPDIYVGACMIDYDRYIHDLRVFDLGQRKVFDLSIPKIKRPTSHVWAGEVSCTDGTKWPILRASLYTAKSQIAFEQLAPKRE